MSRPPLPLGAPGNIRTRRLLSGIWESRCRYRTRTGKTIYLSRRGKTKTAAETRLKELIARVVRENSSGVITSQTRFKVVANLWHEELGREAKLGGRAMTTVRLYRGYLDNWIIKALGELLCAEVTAGVCDGLIKRAHEMKGYDTAKTIRSVLSGICGYAIRHDAMSVNPVRSAARLPRGAVKEVKALSVDERVDLLLKLKAYVAARSTDELGRSLSKRATVWSDVPSQVEGMLATAVRIGELLALDGEDIDEAKGVVAIRWHLVRVTGEGIRRVPGRKGGAPNLLLRVPEWSMPMWRRRRAAARGGPLWPAWDGGWLDGSNASKRLREALDASGYGWVTAHVFRKTVAGVIDEAGGSVSDVANQLGNTKQVAEKHYIAPRVGNAATVAALEGMWSA